MKKKENSNLIQQEHGKISALEIAKFFLSLDQNREYFVKEKMMKVEGMSVPTIGNLRLNKMLHITQMLYTAKHGKYLFSDEILAFEHGGIVYDVYHSFHFLVDSKSHARTINPYLKSFFTKIYNYFRTYTNSQLEDFVHEDPAWFTSWENIRSKKMPQSPKMIKYYQNFALHVIEAIERKNK